MKQQTPSTGDHWLPRAGRVWSEGGNPSGASLLDGIGDDLFASRRVAADAVPVHKFAGDTELAAAKRIAPLAGKLRSVVLGLVVSAGDTGITVKELSANYAAEQGWDESDSRARLRIAPRLTELRDLQLIKDSGRRRDGCCVWIAVKGL